MDKQRRKFLKIAGATAIAGVSAPAIVNLTSKNAIASSEAHGEAAGHGEEQQSTGVRLGMVIDMRKFYGKPELLDKAINACRKEHNLPDFVNEDGTPDTKNEIKWIWKAPFENVFQDHSIYHESKVTKENDFLVLCNHCDSPPCVRVCPTQATFVDKTNGIVCMDYHRCIGCRFCMVACPYGARSFNWQDPRPFIKEYNPEFPTRTRGVVEKCTFCEERRALGQPPACLEAANEVVEGAIVFGDLNDPNSEIRKVLEENHTIQRKPTLGTKPSVFYIV